MPRFFFNIHDGQDIIDQDGTVLRDETEARSEAVILAGRCVSEMGDAFWTHEGDWLLEVSDETRKALFALKFAAVR